MGLNGKGECGFYREYPIIPGKLKSTEAWSGFQIDGIQGTIIFWP